MVRAADGSGADADVEAHAPRASAKRASDVIRMRGG